MISKQTKMIESLSEVNEKLVLEIRAKDERIRELEERLNKNSRNGSKPPLSDGMNKPKAKRRREKSGKSQGDQKNHKGSGFKITKEPTEIITHVPKDCKDCSNLSTC